MINSRTAFKVKPHQPKKSSMTVQTKLSPSELLDMIRARRSKVDTRELGVFEPRWEEKDSEHKVLTLSRETIELLALAAAKHDCCNDPDFEIRYSYGSGIGTNIVAKCIRCGQRYDVTDYGSW